MNQRETLMIIKLIIFAAIQVAIYLFIAFVAWDLAWFVNAGELSAFDRGRVAFLWLGASVLVIGKLNDD